jgi:hypothetical protein
MPSPTCAACSTNSVLTEALRASTPLIAAVASAVLLTSVFLTQISGTRPPTESESPLLVHTGSPTQFAQFPGRPF